MNQQVQHDQLRDFMSGEESALSLYSYYPYDAKDRSSRIAEVRTEKLAPDVLVAFEESNPNPTAETLANLRYVKSGKDVGFVVTGQQVGLFGGPLLTISKALSAIQLAKALEEESGTKMVPVFWLQTEDHDFQEIATSSCLVFGKRWEQISLQEPLSGVGDSVGKIVLSPSMVQDLEYALRELPIPEERLSPILMAYSTGATLPHAFRSVMNHYIGDSGILFFDPCAPSILKRKVSFLQRSYTEWRAIEELLVERGALLTSRGYSQQVNIRAKTPLFSYSYLGQRARLTRKENRWAHPLGVVTDEELTAFFASANDQLTASALLRPVMQEHFFNSSALVLGPAELRYLGQMSPLYKFFGLSEPLLFPRHSFTLVPEYVEELLEKLSLSPSEAAMDLERYAERLLADKGENVEELFSDLTAATTKPLLELKDQFLKRDLQLEKSVIRTLSSLERNLSRFKSKYLSAAKRAEDSKLERFKKLQSLLFPDGAPLERVANIVSFDPKFVLDAMRSTINPFGKEIDKVIRHVPC